MAEPYFVPCKALDTRSLSLSNLLLLQKGVEIIKKATEADANEDYEQALQQYEHGVEYFLHAIKCE